MAVPISDFDVLNVALTGKNLVEAAAGTGKTYSIAIMVLRWILETKNKIDSVIAVTFTNYATAELKERILNFLETALLYLETGDCGDETIKALCSKIQDKDAAVKKLKAAINDFDTSSIFTIHGFCQKLIREHAFDLGIDFNMKLEEDTNPSNDTATIFFRKKIANLNETDENGVNLLENKGFRDKISRNKLADFISKAGIGAENLNIRILGNSAPTTDKLTGIYRNFTEEAPAIAKENRERKNIMGYDDILLILYEVLKQRNNAAQSIQKIMQERYSFVLIDEFQDTDPQQYFIFKELFFSSKHTIFFIGDPKQSIYAFRKADIFSYNEAKTEVDRIYVMAKNFRSSSPAVEAVNEVFSQKDVFGTNSPIEYSSVLAAKKPDEYFLAMNGKPVKGILVREVPNNEKGKPASQEIVKKQTVNHISLTIHEMTKPDSNFMICEKNDGIISKRAVRLSDIAILTATNDFALEICNKLTKAGIQASVEADSAKELYASEEAYSMQKLISAASTKGIAEFRTLLLTFFYNKKTNDILCEDTIVENLHEKFVSCFGNWKEKGFYAAFSQFTEDKDILKNIAGQGEKTIGNLRKLAELIHKHECEEGFSEQGTLKWFNDKIKSKNCENEDENLNSENDGDKKEHVRIMTLHKSKGLEFNIVFFPFILKSSAPNDMWMTQHTKNGTAYERELLFISKNDTTEQTDDALEEIRRIYVGTTRAKYLTICYTQAEKKSLEPTSLFKIENSNFINIQSLAAAECETSSSREKTADKAEPEMRQPEKAERPVLPEWSISSYSGIISGSHGDGGTSEDADTDQGKNTGEPAHDETPKEETVPMADFPNGAEAGTILHSIFEKADFTSDNNREIIRSILKKKMNFKNNEELAAALSAVNECINNIRTAPIFDNNKALADVSAGDKTSEMEFFVRTDNEIRKKELSKIISDNYKIAELDDGTVRKGFLHGFIDLVAKIEGKYYIIDWKSNNLGSRFADYNHEKIEEEMKKHNYYLQFMLYLAAFDRYIATLDPEYSYEKNFGGIRYIFLRGVKAGSCETGIFAKRPEKEETEKILELFKSKS